MPQGGEVIRYEDPRHFCAECHAYTSVKIDCFECHADRGLDKIDQSRLAWDQDQLNSITLQHRMESPRVE
ncbi:MAG: hypothetical protein EP300_14690 [Gammaproteobacteria bacterium]|nr:MAG: hypothetical protein EP300_14690 [Gammaproteobacteria bacterium]